MAFCSWGHQYQFLCAYLKNSNIYVLFMCLHFKGSSPVFLKKSISEDT